MPKKPKSRAPDAATLVRERARALIGTVRPTALIPDKRRRTERKAKHKRDLAS